VQGREKDQINRGGEKIAAEEIENLLLRHQAVIHAALVSMEDSLLGRKSCAYLVVKEPLRAVRCAASCASRASQNLNCRTAWSALMRCR
jgi:2,3-dihydroxybenzoate-AMP ligase